MTDVHRPIATGAAGRNMWRKPMPEPHTMDFAPNPPISEDPVARRLELFDDEGQPLCRCLVGQCPGHGTRVAGSSATGGTAPYSPEEDGRG